MLQAQFSQHKECRLSALATLGYNSTVRNPSYISLSDAEWRRRIDALSELYTPCRLCPRKCGALRAQGKAGECGLADEALVGSVNLHHGEEPPISGYKGSGTVFFSGCNLHCLFCQNYPLSQMYNGVKMTIEQLADAYIELQTRGAHNLNLVTPSHVNYHWFVALNIAVRHGFRLPIVYNCGGYDLVEVLELFDGVIDIYMPDAKYRDAMLAVELSQASDYPEINDKALREMYRQVGDLEIDKDGVAIKGLLIRHLMLPGKLKNTLDVVESIASISPHIAVSLMTQYFPAHKAHDSPGMDARVNRAEYRIAEKRCRELGLVNGYFQKL